MGGREAKLKNQPIKDKVADAGAASIAKVEDAGVQTKGKIVQAVEDARKSASK